MGTSKKTVSFEQVFLEQAFQYSMDDDLGSTGKMLRSLKGLLVQTKVQRLLAKSRTSPHKASEYIAELEEFERHPLKGVMADIYKVCLWIEQGKARVVVWVNDLPIRSISKKELWVCMTAIEDRLNVIAGELCEVLNIDIFDFGSVNRKAAWVSKREVSAGGGTRAAAG